MGAGTSKEEVAEKITEEQVELQNEQEREVPGEVEVDEDGAGDAKMLQKNGNVAIVDGSGEDEEIKAENIKVVEQQDPSNVIMNEESEQNIEVVASDPTPKDDIKQDGEGDSPEVTTPESDDKGQSPEQTNENQSNEVGFKKVFKFVGFKFTVKKEKTEKSDPVQLLTVKKDEVELNGTENHEEQKDTTDEGKQEEVQQETQDVNQEATKTDADAQGVESSEVTLDEKPTTEEEANVEKEEKKSPESPTNPAVTETSSPFKRFFTQGWAGLRKKTSLRKSKEEDHQEVEKHLSEEQEKTEAEEPAKQEEMIEKEAVTEVQSASEEAKEHVKEEVKVVYEEEAKAIDGESTSEESSAKEEIKVEETGKTEDNSNVTENTESSIIVAEETVTYVVTELNEIQTESDTIKGIIVSEVNEVIATATLADAEEPLLDKPDSEFSDKDIKCTDDLVEEKPQLASSTECSELEKSPEAITTEAELLSSQEKARLQGSPLRKLFSGSGLRKLSGKKQKGKKEDDNKVDDVAEQTPATSQSPEAPETDNGDSSNSSPDKSGETSPTDKLLEDTQQTTETEGEGATSSDGEKKKDGIIPWASFKKLVTPKKRPKRPSESDKEDDVEKVKSSTMSSTDSAASVENQEENKEDDEQKLEKSTEENKKKVDSSVSWEALICVGSSKKRTRKTSDSDEEETQKPIEESKNADDNAGDTKESNVENPLVSSQEKEQGTSSPEQVSSPTEADGVSTWQSFKRLVTPRKKSKSRVEDKTEEPVLTSSMEQSTSEGEAGKEETWVSLKKLIPGRKKKKSDGKLDQGLLNETGQPMSKSDTTEDDSDEPAVVPLSEFDAAEQEKLETQQSVDTSILKNVPGDMAPEQPVDELVHAVTVTVIEGERAVTNLEERSPSWISATATEVLEQVNESEESKTREHFKTEVTVEESVINTISNLSEAQQTVINEVELTSEALTALEEAIENSCVEETTEMVSAVSQLAESLASTEEATPVLEEDESTKNLEEQKKHTDQVLQEVAEKTKLSIDSLLVSDNNTDVIPKLCQVVESEVRENLLEQVTSSLQQVSPVISQIEVIETKETQDLQKTVEISTFKESESLIINSTIFSTLEKVEAIQEDSRLESEMMEASQIAKKTHETSSFIVDESAPVLLEETCEDSSPISASGNAEGSPISDEKQAEEGASVMVNIVTVEDAPVLAQGQAKEDIFVEQQVGESTPDISEEEKVVAGAEEKVDESSTEQADGFAEQEAIAVEEIKKDILNQTEEKIENVVSDVQIEESALIEKAKVEVPGLDSDQTENSATILPVEHDDKDAPLTAEQELVENVKSSSVSGHEYDGAPVLSEKQVEENSPVAENQSNKTILIEKEANNYVPVLVEKADLTDLTKDLSYEGDTVLDEKRANENCPVADIDVLAEQSVDKSTLTFTEEQSKDIVDEVTPVLTEESADESTPVVTDEVLNVDNTISAEEQGDEGTPILTEERGDESTPVVTDEMLNVDNTISAEEQGDKGTPILTEEGGDETTPVVTDEMLNVDIAISAEEQGDEGAPMTEEDGLALCDKQADKHTPILADGQAEQDTCVPTKDTAEDSDLIFTEGQANECTFISEEQTSIGVPVSLAIQADEHTSVLPKNQADECIPILEEQTNAVVPTCGCAAPEEQITEIVQDLAEQQADITDNILAEEHSDEIAQYLPADQNQESALFSADEQTKESTLVLTEEQTTPVQVCTQILEDQQADQKNNEVVHDSTEGCFVELEKNTAESVIKESYSLPTKVESDGRIQESQVSEESAHILDNDQIHVSIQLDKKANDNIHVPRETQNLEADASLLPKEETIENGIISVEEPSQNSLSEHNPQSQMLVAEKEPGLEEDFTPSKTYEHVSMHEEELGNNNEQSRVPNIEQVIHSNVVEDDIAVVGTEVVSTNIPEFESSEANKVSEPVAAAAIEEQVLEETVKPIETSPESVQPSNEADNSTLVSSEDHKKASETLDTVLDSVSQKAASIVDAAIEAAASCLVVDVTNHNDKVEEGAATVDGILISHEEQSIQTVRNEQNDVSQIVTIESHSTSIVQTIIETAVETVVSGVQAKEDDDTLKTQIPEEQSISEDPESVPVSELSKEEIEFKQEHHDLPAAKPSSTEDHCTTDSTLIVEQVTREVSESTRVVSTTTFREYQEVTSTDEPQKEVFITGVELETNGKEEEDKHKDVCMIQQDETRNEQLGQQSVHCRDLSSETVQTESKPSVQICSPDEKLSTQDDSSEVKAQEQTQNVES
ncbi:A-kinase anchor protein 12 [Spea bombifrons]|uniref:A-kinase anchor protein 12 n=1 Tax=Spea bombifrons TaxID=233779 RepID=UPI0023490B32|nr:A-kinase anchor protein 12 [Spea bombifrons]